MRKLRLFGLSRSKIRNYYCLEKRQEFFGYFRKFLINLGFEERNRSVCEFGRPIYFDKDNYPQSDETKEDKIEDYVDDHVPIQGKEDRVDTIFGKSRIFLIIFTKSDKQNKITQELKKFCSF